MTIIPSGQIVREKWDSCVAEHGLIYSSSMYLDAMASNWHGVVVDNYAAVMPLPWRRKGIRYYYTPPFIQQLGICGDAGSYNSQAIVDIVNRFSRYGDLAFNFSNTGLAALLPVKSMTNLVIDLSVGYERISQSYQKEVIRYATLAKGEGLQYEHGSHSEAIHLYTELYAARSPHVVNNDYQHFTQLCDQLFAIENCFTRKIISPAGEKLSMAVLFRDKERIYNMLNVSTKNGRTLHSNYLLYDSLLCEFAAESRLFDFEGSNIPGVKHFYQKLGGVAEQYFHYHHNRLPGWLRFIKT